MGLWEKPAAGGVARLGRLRFRLSPPVPDGTLRPTPQEAPTIKFNTVMRGPSHPTRVRRDPVPAGRVEWMCVIRYVFIQVGAAPVSL